MVVRMLHYVPDITGRLQADRGDVVLWDSPPTLERLLFKVDPQGDAKRED